MKAQTYKEKCPSIVDFEKYLANQMTRSELVPFVKHIESCNLCSEAIEGFHAQKINNIHPHINHALFYKNKLRSIHLKTLAQIAASIIILLSLTISIRYISETLHNKNQLAYHKSDINPKTIKGLKKISSNSSDQYLYLGNQNNVLLNDQYISIDQVQSGKIINSETKQIVVQVESDNYKESSDLIASIKEQHQIPVFTFRSIR